MAKAGKIDVPATRRRVAQKTRLFDLQPMTVGGFRLMGRAVVAIGRPTLKQWVGALDFSVSVEDSGPFWIGSLWNYRKTRRDWSDNDVLQALASFGLDLSVKSLENRGYISDGLTTRAKQLAPSFSHGDAVTVLDGAEQEQVLEQAAIEGWTVHETRKRVRAKVRARIIEGQATLEGMYRVAYVDIPWPQYRNRQPSGSGVDDHYHTPLSIDDLCKLPVASHMLPNSVMFFWITAPLLYEATDGVTPDAYRIIRAWDFNYKTNVVWDKVLGSFGDYFHACHEHLLICTRGSCLPDCPVPSPDSVQTIRREREHSKKPEEIRRLITQLYTTGPYLELFGRHRVEGWSVFGDDPRLWVEDAERGAPEPGRDPDPAPDALSDAFESGSTTTH